MHTKTLAAFLASCTVAATAFAGSGSGSATLYTDGILVERELSGAKGIVTLPLPANLIEGSLRVTPGKGGEIRGVEITAVPRDDRRSRELDSLDEQRLRLQDRLQALDMREEIFRTAAKSQSGKAPRKSKANPDPLAAIRQGTDYAIAQLETVYTARRRTTQELRRLDARIGELRSSPERSGKQLRISLYSPRSTVTVRYATSEPGWRPGYHLHLDTDATARLALTPRQLYAPEGLPVRFGTGSVLTAGSAASAGKPVRPGESLGEWLLPVSGLSMSDRVRFSFSGLFTNTASTDLPAGDAAVYRNGAYVGTAVFRGISSGRSRTVALGAP